MGVAVDKAGRDDLAVGIDHALGRRADAADLDDLAAGDADIGAVARQARAVDHGAVLDEQVEGHRRISFIAAARIAAAIRCCQPVAAQISGPV